MSTEVNTLTNTIPTVKTFNINTEILPNREMQITLPDDIPLGPAQIVIIVASSTQTQPPTYGDFLNSEFFGMWKDRTDITDSVEFAQQLRQQAWSRVS